MKIKSIIGLAAAAMMLVACGGKEKQEEAVVVKYNIIKLTPQSREVNYAFPATLAGAKQVNVFPQVQGRITRSFYTNGGHVNKGDALLEIDPTPYRLRVASDEASVRAAEAALSTAKLNYESQQRLYDKKIVSEYVLKTAQNNYLTAQAQLGQAQAALQNSRTDLEHCTVTAPISGIATAGKDNIGLLVGSNMSEPLLTLTDQTMVRAKFSITEDLYLELFRNNKLSEGSKGLQDEQGRTISDWYKNIGLRTKDGVMYEHKGTFITLGGVVDSKTGSVLCKVEFPNPDLILHEGSSASVIFSYMMENRLVIPQTACKKLQDKYLVFRVNAQGEAEGVLVNVVPTDDGKEYIVEDDALKSGDEIIADGVARIEEGQKVK